MQHDLQTNHYSHLVTNGIPNLGLWVIQWKRPMYVQSNQPIQPLTLEVKGHAAISDTLGVRIGWPCRHNLTGSITKWWHFIMLATLLTLTCGGDIISVCALC